MSVSTIMRSEGQDPQVSGHLGHLIPAMGSTMKETTNEIQITTTNLDWLQKPNDKPDISKSPNEAIQKPLLHVTKHMDCSSEADKGSEKNKSFRDVQQEEGWKKIQEECRRRSPTEHLETLRRPNAWSELNGWTTFSPALFNHSETFARLLQRSAILKVNTTVRKWRDICCQKKCCKDKFCGEGCCEEKEDKKMKDACEYQKRRHLKNQLYALGEDVTQWFCGGKTSLIMKAIADVDLETSWRNYQRDLAKAWEANLEYMKQEVEEKISDYGLSLSDLHDLAVAVEAEKADAAKIEGMEKLDRENEAAMDEQEQNKNEDQDEDYDEVNFPHFYAALPSPPLIPTAGNSLREQKSTSPYVYQLENIPLTLPLTPTKEYRLSQLKIAAEDEFGMLIIDYYIEDVTTAGEKYTEKKGVIFHSDWLNEPAEQEPCKFYAWKLHPVLSFTLDCSPPASQKYPEIRVINPEGNIFTFEERLSILTDNFKKYCLERPYWGLYVGELIHQGGTFKQGLYQAMKGLWNPGREPQYDDESDDDGGDDQVTQLEASEKSEIMDRNPASSMDDRDDKSSQEPAYLEPGQKFVITDLEPTMKTYEESELRLVNAVIEDLEERQKFYQDCSDNHFWWAIDESSPPAAQLPLHNSNSWKQHLLSDFTKGLTPKSQSFPEIRVTDPEGNIYFLEEQAAAMDEDFKKNVAKRDAWQSRKDISLEENKIETEGEYCARLRHFAQLETEFRQINDQWDQKKKAGETEQESTTSTPPKFHKRTKLRKARDAIEAFDILVRECLIEVKQEFIRTAQAKWDFESRKEPERKDDKGKILRRLSKTLVKLREKLANEGMVRTEKGGTTYVGQLGEGTYWVEMKGNLGEVWSALGLGGDD